MMPTYRPRTITVEAFQFGTHEFPRWFEDARYQGVATWVDAVTFQLRSWNNTGVYTVKLGDWIVQDSDRHLTVVRGDAFAALYEEVVDE